MKKWLILLVLTLLLTACGPAETAEPGPAPAPEVSDPEPLAPDPQQTAAQWLSDEDHHSFFVNDHVVTVERAAEPTEDCKLILTIWDRANPTTPIQTIPMAEDTRYHGDKSLEPAWSRVEDFNFDYFDDFACVYFMGNQPVFYHVWLWDPESEQYIYEPAFDEICYPEVDWNDQKITGWAVGGMAGSVGNYSIYQWVDGTLTEVRHIKLDYADYEDLNSHYVSVTNLADGEMREVFRLEGNDWMDRAWTENIEPWFNLWYTGE